MRSGLTTVLLAATLAGCATSGDVAVDGPSAADESRARAHQSVGATHLRDGRIALVLDPDALRYLIRLVGAERVALGSDYPFPLGEQEPGSMIESMGDLSAETRELLFSGAALRFLGRSRDEFLAR